MKRSSKILATLGVLLIALAALVHFVVVPHASKLPDNTDSSAHYTGKANLLNAQALAAGDISHAFLTDQDVAMDRHVYVTSATSDVAVVHDDSTINVAGQTLEDNHVYALDRTDLTAGTAPQGTAVEKVPGWTVTLPLHPKAEDSYTLYDPAAQAASELRYLGSDTRGGREVYQYESTAAGEVKSESLLKTLPAALPSALAPALLSSLPAATQQALTSAGPLPEMIPLKYTTSTAYVIWVDKQLGVPLDVSIHRTVTANTNLGPQLLPLLPVLDINVQTTDDSVQASADKAASAGRLLTIMSDVTPILLVALGIVFIGVAVLRRRVAEADVAPTRDLAGNIH